MTDEVVTAAPVPQSVAAPVEPMQAQAEPPRAAIDRAFASIDAGGQTSEASPPVPGADETLPPHAEAPARFSADAKAAWQTAPEALRTETHRALRELETGLTKYQQAFEPLKPYLALAEKHNTTLHEAMERYTALDNALLSDDPQAKLAAITAVLDHAGLTPSEFAERLAGQRAPASGAPPDPLASLRREITDLKNQMGGISTSLTERQRADAKRELDAFTEDHPRLTDIKFAEVFNRLLGTGMAEGLEAAYEMADKLNPAPAPPKPQADPARKGELSVAGAPASGSNPTNRKAPATARESLDRSFASLGIG